MENCLRICRSMLGALGVPFTPHFLKEKLLTHQEPMSLLAISDTLAEYKLGRLALQLGEDKLDQLPLPCVVQVSQNPYPYFTCLSQVSEEWVQYSDVKGKLIKQRKKEFIAQWTLALGFHLNSNAEIRPSASSK